MEYIATLKRISREQLSQILLSDEASKVAVIDVRDDDHIGGHIHGSTHVPSSSLDYRLPQVVRTFANKKTLVFHCALSQQRGPSAALRYMRERAIKLNKGELETSEGSSKLGVENAGVQEVAAEGADQEILVLDKGFVGWQEKYAPIFFIGYIL